MTPPTLSIDVLLFSVLRERVGKPELRLTLSAPATAGDALAALGERYPAIRDYAPIVRLALNEAYAPPETALADGDELALITPVSGG